MSLLEQQLKELQDKKKKADLFKSILAEVQKSPSIDAAENEIAEPVLTELQEFINSQVANIEEGSSFPKDSQEQSPHFTNEEVEILKELSARASQRNTYAEEEVEVAVPTVQNDPMVRRPKTPPPPARRPQPQQRPAGKDLLAFAQEHRHLNGKRVIAHTAQGKLGGVVTGAQSPNLWIKTDQGPTIPVPPEQITLE